MSIPGESVEWTYAFSSFGKIPGSVTAGLYDESVFSVIINHQTVFQIIYIISGSHQQQMAAWLIILARMLTVSSLDSHHPKSFPAIFTQMNRNFQN